MCIHYYQQIQLGEELLAAGDLEAGVEHLGQAVAVCGQTQQLLSVSSIVTDSQYLHRAARPTGRNYGLLAEAIFFFTKFTPYPNKLQEVQMEKNGSKKKMTNKLWLDWSSFIFLYLFAHSFKNNKIFACGMHVMK